MVSTVRQKARELVIDGSKVFLRIKDKQKRKGADLANWLFIDTLYRFNFINTVHVQNRLLSFHCNVRKILTVLSLPDYFHS